MILSYKVRLEPNNKQAQKFKQFAGAARYAYNWAIAKEIEAYELGLGFINETDLRKDFTQHKKSAIWLYNVSNDVIKQAIRDAVIAFKNFFKKKADFPQFKSKKKTKPSFYQDVFKLKVTDTHIKIEKISDSKKINKQKLNWIKLSERNRIPVTNNKYKNPRITFDGIHWYISISTEMSNKQTKPSNKGIGIDLGIKNLAICSNGQYYPNINKSICVKKLEKRLHRKRRQISKKYEKNKKGQQYVKTNNIIKSEKNILKLNHKLTNIRNNYIHQVINDIIKREPSFIVLEDLNISGMLKNKHLSKSTQQQNLYKFRNILAYKAEQNNIKLIIADRFYPSSKTCSSCGNINHNLKLSERTFICNNCKIKLDRDYNASLNLYHLGNTVSLAGINACGVLYQTKVAKAKSDTMKQESNIKSIYN